MLKNIIKLILSLLNKVIPKSGNKIVLYSFPDFSDNAWALYTYLIDNSNKKYKYYWFVTDPAKFRSKKLKKTYFYNSKGRFSFFVKLYHTFTSKYVFVTHMWLPIYPAKNQNIIYLWHGSPLKKIALMDPRKPIKTVNYFSYIIGYSEKYAPIMEKSFACSSSQVLLFGNMRNDLLFEDSNVLDELGFNDTYKKIIIYMPTFKKVSGGYSDILTEKNTETGLQIFLTKESLISFNNFLSTKNLLFIIKLHPSEDLSVFDLTNYSNIKFLLNKDIEIKNIQLYHLLGKADAIISDYSSVYLDYLLLNKPIGFVIDDYESYLSARGFLFENVISMMPGQLIRNKEQLIEFLINLLNKTDEYEEERLLVSAFANKYPDNRNRERLINFLKM
jgi:CDP-glycerol glycerophosphotransferase (TagB/SpsB family)